MTEISRALATKRLDDSIHFRRAGSGYFVPDLIVDRDALTLIGVTLKPTKSADDLIYQLSDKAWVTIHFRPLSGKL